MPTEPKKKKKGKKPLPPKGDAGFSAERTLFDDIPDAPAPVVPPSAPAQAPGKSDDGHAKAARLARRLAKHARSGKVGADQLKDGLAKLKAFGRGHIETAARSLGLGGPMGGGAGRGRR